MMPAGANLRAPKSKLPAAAPAAETLRQSTAGGRASGETRTSKVGRRRGKLADAFAEIISQAKGQSANGCSNCYPVSTVLFAWGESGEMEYFLVTNNPLVKGNTPAGGTYLAGPVIGSFCRSGPYPWGHRLTHPLSGSLKPGRIPFKTVFLSRKREDLDFASSVH